MLGREVFKHGHYIVSEALINHVSLYGGLMMEWEKKEQYSKKRISS